MERTQEEIFQEENKLIAGRIQKIAETIKKANPQADCFGTSGIQIILPDIMLLRMRLKRFAQVRTFSINGKIKCIG